MKNRDIVFVENQFYLSVNFTLQKKNTGMNVPYKPFLRNGYLFNFYFAYKNKAISQEL